MTDRLFGEAVLLLFTLGAALSLLIFLKATKHRAYHQPNNARAQFANALRVHAINALLLYLILHFAMIVLRGVRAADNARRSRTNIPSSVYRPGEINTDGAITTSLTTHERVRVSIRE